MSERIFIVISVSEDGSSLERLTESKLLKQLNDGEFGDREFFTSDDLDRNGWSMMDRRGVFIVDGDLVSPTPKERVTEWSIAPAVASRRS